MKSYYRKTLELDGCEKTKLQEAIEVLDKFMDALGDDDPDLRSEISEAQKVMENLKYGEFIYEG